MAVHPTITAAPGLQGGALVHRQVASSGSSAGGSSSSSALDTCGYLSGDFASPLTCGLGYTCSTGPSLIPSHLGCCNTVNCAPSSGAHTCITAESGSISCTGTHSTACIEQYTSLLFCTDDTAPACVTYSQPPPSSGSLADSGFSPTIFSYACGPTQTTHIYLATATNAPPGATPTPHHSGTSSFTHLPIYAYESIGLGALIIIMIILQQIQRKFFRLQPVYYCRHCDNTALEKRTVVSNNPNGNGGREFCRCTNPRCRHVQNSRLATLPEYSGWVSWLDDKGISRRNPACWRGKRSRLDFKGFYSGHVTKVPFYTCGMGACGYHNETG